MAELSHRKRIPGARLVWLFRVTLVQRTLVSAGRQVPGRSVRWGNLRRLRPFSDRYGYDRGTPIERYYIERFLSEHAQRIRGSVLEAKDARYSRRFGCGTRLYVVNIDPHDPGTDFWRFTPNGLVELLHPLGMPASVAGYGNMLACVASLLGPSVDELSLEELDVADSHVPLVACAHAEKAR